MRAAARAFLLAGALLLLAGVVACEGNPILGGDAPLSESSFVVLPGEKHTVTVSMRAGETLDGTVNVGGQGDSIDFYVHGPERDLAFGVVRVVGGSSFTLRATKGGAHTMYFDNSISFGESKQVTVRYRVR
jgi:hypothetical protein